VGSGFASVKEPLSMPGFNLKYCCFEYFLSSISYLKVYEDDLVGWRLLESFGFGFLFEISMLIATIIPLDLHDVRYNLYAHSKLI
jgi:hypothetical protein